MEPLTFAFPKHYQRIANTAAIIAFATGTAFAISIWFLKPEGCVGQSSHEPSIALKAILSIFFEVMGAPLAALFYFDGREVRWQRVTIEQDRLIFQRDDSTSELLISELRTAFWRCRPLGGALVLTSMNGRQILRLDQIPREQRLSVIRILYRLLPAECQANWPEFCRQFALPLRRWFGPPRSPGPGERRLTRRRFDLLFGAATPIVLGVVMWVWWYTGNARGLAIVAFLFGLWALVRFSHPKQGIIVRPESQPPSARPTIIASLLMLIAAIPLSFAAASVAKSLDGILGVTAAILIAASAFLPILIVSHKYRDADNAWRERKQAEAVAEWEYLTPSDI